MALPNPGMDFTPFDILTAEELDQIVENVESLADGTGLDNGAVTGDKLNSDNIATIDYVPSSNIETTSSSLADWVNLGDITVPSWATTALITVHVSGVLVTSAGNVSYRMKIGGDVGGITVRATGTNTAANQYLSTSWGDSITVSPGTRSVVLQGSTAAGTLRASTVATISVSIRFIA